MTNKIDVYKYFSSKPLPKGFYLVKTYFPKKPRSPKTLEKEEYVINCSCKERFDKALSTYSKKIRKIEKDFGVKCVGGGTWLGTNEYDNNFVFTKETIENFKAVIGTK